MSLAKNLKDELFTAPYTEKLCQIYGCTPAEASLQKDRYAALLDAFTETFGPDREIRLFSAPGRTEIGGNHTDHQRGHVLAASVNLDTIAACSLNESGCIQIQSEGYDMIRVPVKSISGPEEKQKNTTLALVRGMAHAFIKLGYPVSGFDCQISSNVLKGSGLSSSAAFEVLIGNILNGLFAGGCVDAIKIAQLSQYAENVYFGKPSGLMDQMASSVGGFVTIDFFDPENPKVEKVPFDFSKSGHTLCIVDGVGDHADLTPEYAAIPEEMKRVSAFFGKEVLSEVDPQAFYKNLAAIRKKAGDRAVLRALHFFSDDARVPKQVAALLASDFDTFKRLVTESGHSSYMYLQNVYPSSHPEEQCLSVALAVSERVLAGQGAVRVHGGGFAGTIQAFVPNNLLSAFKQELEAVFGPGACHTLNIRPIGGTEVTL